MAIQGLRDTSGFTVGGDRAQRPENWREGIMLLFPNGDTPLTALTSVMKSESTDDAKYHWFEKTMSDQRFAMTTNLAVGGNLVCAGGGMLEIREGHILLVEQTGELIHIIDAPTNDTTIPAASMVRNFTTDPISTPNGIAVTVAGAGVNPNVLIVGSAFEEGSDSPVSVSYNPEEQYGLTQIFRHTLEATRTAIKTRLRTGEHVREAKREALQYHTIEMERAFWYGKRTLPAAVRLVNGKPWRTTEGFLAFMDRVYPTNVATLASGNLSMTLLETHLKNMFNYGSSEKFGFCGNRALLAVNQCIRLNSASPYTLRQGQKEFGMTVSRLVCPFGELVLKTHPLFNRVTSGTTAGTPYYGSDAMIAAMDMEQARYRYLKDSDTKYEKNLQDNGVDGMTSGYLTECGLEFRHAKSHYVLKAVANGIAG
jgi:hypothetical protein